MSNLWPGPASDQLAYISNPPSEAWQSTFPRHLVILGATGSIGQSALALVRAHPDRFVIEGLACATNVEVLAREASFFRPRYLAVLDKDVRAKLQALLPKDYKPKFFVGHVGYERLARVPEADTVLCAQSGASGLSATLSALLAGRVLCLANKESLVLAGGLIRAICARTKASILPIDSEHNALFQCLAGRSADVSSVILTASGGPFRDCSPKDLAHVTREQALKHPNWSMGKKITIDSATMMNKGLEVIEAYHLYGLPIEKIEVLIHPQSIIHSMVRFRDSSLLAQLAVPDMKLPIAHCLLWPLRENAIVPPLDLTKVQLTFAKPNMELYPCLDLALQALAQGDEFCVHINAANEAAVELFLQGKIPFSGIARLVHDALMRAFAKQKEKGLNLAALEGLDERDFAAQVWAIRDRLTVIDVTVRADVYCQAEQMTF